MEGNAQDVNPNNPRCPICGAVDWFSVPDCDYTLFIVRKGANTAVLVDGKQLSLPVEGFTCKSCRFLRLRALHGTLEWPDADHPL